MKLGPVQPIAPPPVAPLPVAAVPAVPAAQQQARTATAASDALPARDDDPHSPAHGQGQRKGTQFKSPRNSQPRSTQAAKPARTAPGPRPAPNAPGAADAPSTGNADGQFNLDIDDEEEIRRRHAGHGTGSTSSDSDPGSGSGGDQGGQQDRKFAAIKRLRLGDLSAPRQVATDGIAAAMRTAQPVEALTAHLSGMARGAIAPVESNAMAAYVLRAAQVWLASQGPAASGGTATLASVRATLVDSGGPAGAALTERHAAACVWLPVFLLNLDKPRTPKQREQAIDRLAMLERRLALSRGQNRG